MTNEEALKTIETATMKVALKVNNDIEDFIIQSVIQEIGDKTIEVNAKKIADAIEKQIPKTTYDKDGGAGCTKHFCSLCGKRVGFDVCGDFTHKDNFCPNCGQALEYFTEWSEE